MPMMGDGEVEEWLSSINSEMVVHAHIFVSHRLITLAMIAELTDRVSNPQPRNTTKLNSEPSSSKLYATCRTLPNHLWVLDPFRDMKPDSFRNQDMERDIEPMIPAVGHRVMLRMAIINLRARQKMIEMERAHLMKRSRMCSIS